MACMLIEQKLIKRIKKKQDKEAANALISYYYKEIYAYVYRQTGNEELAKDLTQDIFIQILQKITMFDHDLFFCIDHPISVKTTFNII